MENRIKNYEQFIKEAAKHPTSELKIYHSEMVRNFQHERAVHLIVMLFFVALTLVMMTIAIHGIIFVGGPFTIFASIIAALLFIITAFYIKHYYFLENHIQKLYDITVTLYKND